MKIVVSVLVVLALSATAFGQRPEPGQVLSLPGELQPDPTGQRLQELLKAAYELEQAGKGQDAVLVRQQADLERQALLRRLDALQAEIDMIRQATGAGVMVMVHVQVFEVSTTKLKKLGYDWAKLSGDSVATSTTGAGANWRTFGVLDDGPAMQQTLEALRKDNLVRVLAEPKLVTLSGRKAVFHGGNELTIPVPQADGSMALDHRFSNEIEFTPQVLGDNIRLVIHGRISELDPARTIQVGKQTIPGIRLAEFETATEMRNGRTLVLRGLRQSREEAENVGVPYLSEVPYAGAVFRKAKVTLNEMETFVVVRPEIVATPPAAAVPVAGPQPIPPSPQGNRLEFGYPSTANRPSEGTIRR